MKIKSPKDFWSGLMFIVTGLFFLIWAVIHYNMGTAVRMGPAYFPVLLGGLLAVFAHKDGKGYDMVLDCLPLDGRISIREPKEK